LSSIKPQQVTYVVPGTIDFDCSRIAEFLEKAQDLLVRNVALAARVLCIICILTYLLSYGLVQDPTILECAWMELSEKDKSVTVQEFADVRGS
jgi:hypothetical protein